MKTTLLPLCLIALFTSSLKAQCWKAIAGGINHSIVIGTDSTMWGSGSNSFGQLGVSGSTFPTKLNSSRNWDTIIAVGSNHNIAKKIDGTLWAFGDNASGKLGIGVSTASINIPTQIGTDTDWKKIVAGYGHSAALKSDSTLWMWGDNIMGQLGNGTGTGSSNTPVQVGAAKWIAIAGEGNHMLGIQKDSTLWAWGNNQDGQCATGSTIQVNVPTQVGAAKWKVVAAGYRHSLAIKNDGTLWSSGYNQYGQLGIGTSGSSANSTTLTQVGTDKWVSVAVGAYHTLAINELGLTLWAWGQSSSGQLGNNSTTANSSTPILIRSSKWKTLTTGENYSFGISDAGDVYAWGENTFQKLTILGSPINVPTLKGCGGVGINENIINESVFSVYPNPAQHTLNFQNTSSFEMTQLVIMDVTGREVLVQQGSFETINIENLNTGVYLLKVQFGDKSYQTKFIKD